MAKYDDVEEVERRDENIDDHHEYPGNQKLPLVLSQADKDENGRERSENGTTKEQHAEQNIC